MNKLFGLFLLALAFLPGGAEAAARFAVCNTTCTWDNTSTAMWSTSSGGATGASAPTSADTVTFDAATCVGGTTCTITTFAGTISVQTITWGACTASTTGCIINASVNNTNFAIANSSGTLFSGTGTGTRKWLAGTGTYTLTRSSSANPLNMVTTTNDQGSVFSGATWVFAGTSSANVQMQGASFSYGPTTFNANTSGGYVQFFGAMTFASLTINGLNVIQFQNVTVTGALTTNGTSSTAMAFINSDAASPSTMTLGAASGGTWVALRGVTTAGAGAFTATNCVSLGVVNVSNAGGSCTAPSGGGGSRGIIGSGF